MSPFPTTRRSAVLAARSADAEERRRAYDAIVAVYWKPAYAYARWHWRASPDDASDLVQGFFAHAFETGTLERYDPARARFRTWLRACLDGHVSNERRAEQRLKRGGGVRALSLDFAGAEAELSNRMPVDSLDPEMMFEQEWVRALFTEALETLRARCGEGGRQIPFDLFFAYDVMDHPEGAEPSYADLARTFALPITQVTNHLHRVRREFREILLDRLRELTIDEQEFRAEVRRLLGRDA